MRFVTSVTSVSNFTYSSNSQSEAQWVSKVSDFFCTFLWFCVSYVSMITWNQGLRCHILRCTSWYHVICIMKCKLTIDNSARWKLMIDYQVSIESQVQSLHVTLFFAFISFYCSLHEFSHNLYLLFPLSLRSIVVIFWSRCITSFAYSTVSLTFTHISAQNRSFNIHSPQSVIQTHPAHISLNTA